MSNELATLNLPISNIEESQLAAMVTSAAWLPRLQLYGSNSNLCKERKMTPGHYGLVRAKDQVEDLGEELDVMPLALRVKALQIDGNDIITVYDHTSPEYQRIAEQSVIKDSGCMYGPEFLLWIPDAVTFATFFLSSPSARGEAPSLLNLLKERSGATLKWRLAKNKKNQSWEVPIAIACSSWAYSLPLDQIAEQVNKFLNPPKDEREKVEETSERAR